MMQRVSCLAMILAGGQGCRLGALTAHIAKPSVSFGGKYRLIDFALSNCMNSGIEHVGVLTQYHAGFLHDYIDTGATWGFDGVHKTLTLLPSCIAEGSFAQNTFDTQAGYAGTADAIYQNLSFIKHNAPDYVLVLAADQLYQMDYQQLIAAHQQTQADVTIAVTSVDAQEAKHLGMTTLDECGRLIDFVEKPINAQSGWASMGIYVFTTDVLVDVLCADAADATSTHDFGKDIIPTLLKQQCNIHTFKFDGYWHDVGTIASYYDASMSLLDCKEMFDPDSPLFPTKSNEMYARPAQILPTANVAGSVLAQGCVIRGRVLHSIVSYNVCVEEGASVQDSVLMPGACIESGASVTRAIIGEQTTVHAGECVGCADVDSDIELVIAPIFIEE